MERLTKKTLALSLYQAGRSVEDIARALETHPSYVANILAAAGKSSDYSDLYTSTVAQSGYAQRFRGVLRFKDIETARESVEKIDALYHEFEMAQDRRGQHQAQLTALIGKNRAEGIGKYAEAKLFADWLTQHLTVHVEEPRPRRERDPYTGTLAFAG
jgi:hypothetical protein